MTDLPVIRDDFMADGWDLEIPTPNGDSVLVPNKHGVGLGQGQYLEPATAIVINDEVRASARAVGEMVRHPAAAWQEWNRPYTYWVELWGYDPWCYTGNDYGGGCYYYFSYPITISGSAFFHPEAQRFGSSPLGRALMQAGSLEACAACMSMVNQYASSHGLGFMDGRTVGQAARVTSVISRVGVGVIIADDVTVVGVADNVALLPLFAIIGISEGVLYWLDHHGEDKSVEPQAAVEPQAGGYGVPNNFDPCKPGTNGGWDFESAPDAPDSKKRKDLRDQLVKAGWPAPTVGKPNAHHIVPLNQGANGDGDRARAVLSEVGIGENTAATGTWLPTEAGVSDAKLHKYDLHSPAALKKIADRLTGKAAGLSGDARKMSVCNELKAIREEMSKGTFDPNAP